MDFLENHGNWYYEMQSLGYNYRMTDIQAALGITQLNKSDNWVARRRELVHKYDKEFQSIDNLSYQLHPDFNKTYSYHLYIIQCSYRAELYQFLKEKGINTQVHYIPIHLQPYYKNRFKFKRGDFPNAEKYYDRALSLPLYPGLSDNEQNRIIALVKEFYQNIDG